MDFFDLEAHDGTNANPSVEGAERQRMVAIDIDFILISKTTMEMECVEARERLTQVDAYVTER